MRIKVLNPNNLPTVNYKDLVDIQGDLKMIDRKALEKLKNSIKKHGVFVPKFVWKDEDRFYIIDGHQTKKALEELEKEGYEIPEIPYVEVEARNKKDAADKLLQINSRYGKINPNTTFFKVFDLEPEIVEAIEIPELVWEEGDENIKEGLIEDDEIPIDAETRCKYGDLWELGEHRLLCGDATKREDVERLMGGRKGEYGIY